MAGSKGTRVSSTFLVRWVGTLLGLALSAGLVSTIVHDHAARIEAARRQSAAVAQGVDRLLRYEIRNLERALNGMAEDADAYAADPSQRDLPAIIRGVISRNAELQDIDLVGAQARYVYAGINGPQTVDPTMLQRSVIPGKLGIGNIAHRDRSQPVVQLIVRTPAENWLIARLRVGELQSMLRDLDVGSQGNVSIMRMDGAVLASQGIPVDYTTQVSALATTGFPTSVVRTQQTGPLDDVERLIGYSSASGYPFVVAAGVSRKEALAPWRNSALISLGLLLLYWSGMFYLMRRMTASETNRRRVLSELQRQADWLSKAQEASHTGVWAMDTENDQVRSSPHALELFGFSRDAGPMPVDEFFRRIDDADRRRVEQEFAQAWENGEPFASEYLIVLPEGQRRWISAHGAPARDLDSMLGMTGTVMDVTEQRLQQIELAQAESQFRELFERNPLPFWVFDTESLRFLAVNSAAVRRYGYSREAFLGMSILQIQAPATTLPAKVTGASFNEASDAVPICQHVTSDGRLIHVRVHSSSIRFNGREARLVLAEDVSDRVAYEADLSWRASHEESTGLLQLRTLLDRVDSATQAPGNASAFAFVCVQLRDLELVSPTFGRRTREEIINDVARRLERVSDRYGCLAYVPADTFVLATQQAENWNELVDELSAVFAEPIDSDTGRHRVEAWLGIAFQQPGEPAELAAGHAALAALEARTQNLARMHYSPVMAERAADRLATVSRLRSALTAGEFELFFQPIQRLRDGRIIVAEALLRWQRDGSYISPATFIPLCEESGLIVPIGDWVIEHAARARQQLSSAGNQDISIAVNVSAVQFMSGSVASALRQAHERYQLPRGALHVELTESAMLQRPDVARAAMQELQESGVCLSIDDFGTGFSSMSYLRDLPLDHLKIDRSFVQNVQLDPRNASICNALIALSKGLDLNIVAEGVENQEELDWLRVRGVDCVQGFHIAPPMPLQDLIAWLAARVPAPTDNGN